MDEGVALEFAADVEEAVANVKELSGVAQDLADTAKEAADGVAGIAGPAGAAAEETGQLAESAGAAAEGLHAVGDAAEEAAGQAQVYTDASGRMRDANGRFVASAAAAGDAAEGGGAKAAKSASFWGRYKLAILAVVAAIALSIHGAAEFDQSTTKLVTSAGESARNLGMVQQGLLQMSAQLATSTGELSAGAYTVESAGFHGANALIVLRAAAQGASEEGANVGTMANAVTTALNAYSLGASHSTAITNQMLAAVGGGKMTLEDFAGSLSAVLPVAAAAHLSFAQVAGAEATMTGQGMSAQQASQDLANIIRSLIHPTSVSSSEMRALGLNANEVSANLGKAGLTGTLQTLTEAILRNSQGGSVMLGYMREMTPQAQGVARAILAGSISTKELRAATQAMNPEQARLISLFENAATSATGLKQTYAGAMAAMTGGATGLNVALMLGGQHAGTFAANVKTVSAAAAGAGKDVNGWKERTKEASFQLSQAKYSIEAMGISLGMALLPALNTVLRPLNSFLVLVAGNKAASIALAVVIGALATTVIAGKLSSAIKGSRDDLEGLADGVISLARRMGLLTAATEAQTTATEAGTVAQEEADVAMDANPIGLIILAIAALIVVIVLLATHWRQVWRFLSEAGLEAWHVLDNDVLHPIEHGIAATGAWIAKNWKLVAAWLVDPIGMAVYEIRKHTHQIAQTFDDMRHDVAHVLDEGRHDIAAFADWVPREIEASYDQARHQTAQAWDWLRHAVAAGADDVVRFFRQLPGRILHELEALPGQMLTLGKNIILGLINGIKDAATAIPSLMSSMAHTVESYFTNPLQMFSPSRKFFSHGVNTVRGYINGVLSQVGALRAAMRGLGGGVATAGIGGYGAAAAGGYGASHATVNFTANFAPGMQGYNTPQFYHLLQEAVQEAVLRYNVNNPGNGLAIATGGRAAL